MINLIILIFKIYAKKRPGVLFQDIDTEKYIGQDKGSGQLKLVDYKEAIRFKLEELPSDASAKKMSDINTENTFTETGWWIFPKNFYMKDYKKESKQGFQIVYYKQGEYILMRDGSCLSVKSGVFKKVNCERKDVNVFRMCQNRKCKDPMESLLKDMKMIKRALLPLMGMMGPQMGGKYPDFDKMGGMPYENGFSPEDHHNDWSSEKFKNNLSKDNEDSSDSNSMFDERKGKKKRNSDSDSSSDFEKGSCLPINPWMFGPGINGFGKGNMPYGGYPQMPGYGPMMGRGMNSPYFGSNTNC